MARVKTRTLSWAAVSDAQSYLLYVGAASLGAAWLTDVDAGKITPWVTVQAPTLTYTVPASGTGALQDGNYQFAVCAVDAAGNISDPAQTPKVVNVPFDETPPAAPANFSIT